MRLQIRCMCPDSAKFFIQEVPGIPLLIFTLLSRHMDELSKLHGSHNLL